MEHEVRYCTTEDGGRIAYCVEGEGPAYRFTLKHAVVPETPTALFRIEYELVR